MSGKLWRQGALGVLAAALVLGMAGSAQAQWPGRNGRVATVRFQLGAPDRLTFSGPAGGHVRTRVKDARCPQLAGFELSANSLAYSPDGRTVAFMGIDCSGSFLPHLYTLSIDGGAITEVHTDALPFFGVAFAPDGRSVYFAGQGPAGGQGVFRVGLDGTGEQQVVAGTAESPSVSPDGRTITWLDARTFPMHVWMAGADGSDPRDITPANVVGAFSAADYSPDGTTLVTQAQTTGDPTCSGWLQNCSVVTFHPGDLDAVVIGGGAVPQFSPDGRRILFMDDDDASPFGAYTERLDGTDHRLVAPFATLAAWQPVPIS